MQIKFSDELSSTKKRRQEQQRQQHTESSSSSTIHVENAASGRSGSRIMIHDDGNVDGEGEIMAGGGTGMETCGSGSMTDGREQALQMIRRSLASHHIGMRLVDHTSQSAAGVVQPCRGSLRPLQQGQQRVPVTGSNIIAREIPQKWSTSESTSTQTSSTDEMRQTVTEKAGSAYRTAYKTGSKAVSQQSSVYHRTAAAADCNRTRSHVTTSTPKWSSVCSSCCASSRESICETSFDDQPRLPPSARSSTVSTSSAPRGGGRPAVDPRLAQGFALTGSGRPRSSPAFVTSERSSCRSLQPADFGNAFDGGRCSGGASVENSRSSSRHRVSFRNDADVHRERSTALDSDAVRSLLPAPVKVCTARQPAIVTQTVHSREIDRPELQVASRPACRTPVSQSRNPSVPQVDVGGMTTNASNVGTEFSLHGNMRDCRTRLVDMFSGSEMDYAEAARDRTEFYDTNGGDQSADKNNGNNKYDTFMHGLSYHHQHSDMYILSSDRLQNSELSLQHSATEPCFRECDTITANTSCYPVRSDFLGSGRNGNFSATDFMSANGLAAEQDWLLDQLLASNPVSDETDDVASFNPQNLMDALQSVELYDSEDVDYPSHSMQQQQQQQYYADDRSSPGSNCSGPSAEYCLNTVETVPICEPPCEYSDGADTGSQQQQQQQQLRFPTAFHSVPVLSTASQQDEPCRPSSVIELDPETDQTRRARPLSADDADRQSSTASAAAGSDLAGAASSTSNDEQSLPAAGQRRSVMYYPPQAYKFYIAQHMENVIKAYHERLRHRAQLEEEMERLGLDADARSKMRRMLFQKESYHNRLKRTRMTRSAFDPIAVLGRGAFGDVTLVRKSDTNVLYAMKKLRKSEVLKRKQVAHVKAERDILAEADNEWIVRLYYSFQDTNYLYFVMEYIPGGDLMGLLIKLGVFDEDLSRFYIAELVLAIESVHRMGFIHRDIKPDNVLIDRHGHIKLTDFGLCTGFHWTHDSSYYHQQQARPVDKPDDDNENAESSADNTQQQRRVARSLVGTPNYIAPEVLSQSGYTSCCDWWSVGVILYEMRIGQPPFLASTPHETQIKVLNWQSTLRIPNVNNLQPLTHDLISKLLCDQKQRIGRNGSTELKQHPYFNEVVFDDIRHRPAPFVPRVTHPTDISNFDAATPIQTSPPSHAAGETDETSEDGKHAFLEFTFRRFFDDDDGRMYAPNCGTQDALYL